MIYVLVKQNCRELIKRNVSNQSVWIFFIFRFGNKTIGHNTRSRMSLHRLTARNYDDPRDHSPFQSNRFYLLQLLCCSTLISNNSCRKNWSCMSFCRKLYAVASSIDFKSRRDKINTISAKFMHKSFDLNSFVSNWYSRALARKFIIKKPETETETRKITQSDSLWPNNAKCMIYENLVKMSVKCFDWCWHWFDDMLEIWRFTVCSHNAIIYVDEFEVGLHVEIRDSIELQSMRFYFAVFCHESAKKFIFLGFFVCCVAGNFVILMYYQRQTRLIHASKCRLNAHKISTDSIGILLYTFVMITTSCLNQSNDVKSNELTWSIHTTLCVIFIQ